MSTTSSEMCDKELLQYNIYIRYPNVVAPYEKWMTVRLRWRAFTQIFVLKGHLVKHYFCKI